MILCIQKLEAVRKRSLHLYTQDALGFDLGERILSVDDRMTKQWRSIPAAAMRPFEGSHEAFV